MKPQTSKQQSTKTVSPATSPWTEAYQARHTDWSRDPYTEAQRTYHDDTQRPTHDALSNIYNPDFNAESV